MALPAMRVESGRFRSFIRSSGDRPSLTDKDADPHPGLLILTENK
jgi:hypothetical protein